MMKKLFSGRHFKLKGLSLRRLEDFLSGKRKPSQRTLDRLALLAGFQSWHDLRAAAMGDADATLNYEEERKGK